MNYEKEILRNKTKTNQKGNMHLKELSHTKPIRYMIDFSRRQLPQLEKPKSL